MDNEDFEKNSVKAEGQSDTFRIVEVFPKQDAALKVLFVGNSITRHGVKEEIGWLRDCGMAASCKEKDYVHLTVQGLEKKYGPVAYCIVHAVDWERRFDDFSVLEQYGEGKRFDADIIVVRIGENSDREKASAAGGEKLYARSFAKMIEYFKNDHCRVYVTSLFWRYETFDAPIRAVAEQSVYRYIPIGDLGDRADCKALGEFWHDGVAKHPNDRGMFCIAERIVHAVAADKDA